MRAKERRGRKPKEETAAYPAARLVNSLPGRVTLVTLIAIAAALGCALLLRSGLELPFAVLRWTAAALLGMAAGLAARALLADRTATLRLWAALLALLAGLVTLGLMTGGGAGAALPVIDQAELNWTWLVQFALGAALAWLTLHAFPVASPEKPRSRKRTAAARTAPSGAARKKSTPKKSAADRGENQQDGLPSTKPARKSTAKNTRPAAQATSRPPSRPRSGGSQSQPAAAQNATLPEGGAAAPHASNAGRVRASSTAGRLPAARRRPVIHPEAAPVTRTLWTHPLAQPERRAASARRASSPPQQTPDLAQLWQGVHRRVQIWRHGALGSQAQDREAPSPSPAAHTVQPRGSARAAVQPAPVDRPASVPRRRSAAERIRAAGEAALPAWQVIKERIRPKPGRSRPAAKDSDTQHTSPVRLLGEEEHRCPFCLELVEPGDGRGMVECPICHTRHHADCWAVTGACQVPHYHG